MTKVYVSHMKKQCEFYESSMKLGFVAILYIPILLLYAYRYLFMHAVTSLCIPLLLYAYYYSFSVPAM